MVGKISSRRMIGRDAELAVLRELMEQAAGGSARIALVSGDAGIGKTRLVTSAMEGAAGFLAAQGGCIQLGTLSVAYAPFTEALRRLRVPDEDLADRVAKLQARLGGASAPEAGPLFEQALALLRELGTYQPVLLVLEDLHWADASTRDLLTFLARNLSDAAVALVVTYRADEITRQHPLRQVLANLERDAQVERLELAPLDRPQLRDLLAEIRDEPMEADAIDRIYARSGGNPFYVEEFVAADTLDALPERVADVVLARTATLSGEAQDTLRAAAVLGDEIEDDLLAAVVGHDVTGRLRDAVELGVLVLDGTTCAFRHALVREALAHDLLPGERARLHVAAAHAIEAARQMAEHVRWARIAHHWDAAGDVPRAYTASVRAAEEAERVHAFGDAADQYERALRLGEGVSVDLMLRASDAMQTGSRAESALRLAESALRELGDDAAPEERALVYERIGRINWKLRRGPAAVAAYEAATALVAERPPSREKAFVLSARGQSLLLRQRYREAHKVLRLATATASAVGADDVQGHVQSSLGPCLIGMGQVEESVAAMRRAVELSTGADDRGRAYANLISCLYAGGRYDDVVAEADAAIDSVVRSGHARFYGGAIVGNAILSLHALGRWDEAERLHDDPRVPNGEAYEELRWLPVLFDSGRIEEARSLLTAMLAATADADDVQFRALALLHAAELALIDGRVDDSRELVADAQVLIAPTDDQLYAARALGLAAAVATRWAERAGDRRDEAGVAGARAEAERVRDAARTFAAELAARGAFLLPEPAAWLVTVEAEYADDAEHWAEAARAWTSVGHPLRGAAAQHRQADALLRRTRERKQATELLRAALAVAEGIGADPLAEQIRGLATRARLDLRADASPLPSAESSEAAEEAVADRLALTARELDVLRLVARGRTNRQIGEALFIAEKTASVHVTNLLRKLGVANRVEAAAVASRSGLV